MVVGRRAHALGHMAVQGARRDPLGPVPGPAHRPARQRAVAGEAELAARGPLGALIDDAADAGGIVGITHPVQHDLGHALLPLGRLQRRLIIDRLGQAAQGAPTRRLVRRAEQEGPRGLKRAQGVGHGGVQLLRRDAGHALIQRGLAAQGQALPAGSQAVKFRQAQSRVVPTRDRQLPRIHPRRHRRQAVRPQVAARGAGHGFGGAVDVGARGRTGRHGHAHRRQGHGHGGGRRCHSPASGRLQRRKAAEVHAVSV